MDTMMNVHTKHILNGVLLYTFVVYVLGDEVFSVFNIELIPDHKICV